jgi:phage gpG-like protein
MKITFANKMHKKGSIKLNTFAKAFPIELRNAFRTVGALLTGKIKENLSGMSHSQYPGNDNPFPGVIHGRLRDGVNFQLRKNGVIVGPSRLNYAQIHEFGGYTGRNGTTYIPPRPYVEPAWDELEDTVFRVLGEFIIKPMKK